LGVITNLRVEESPPKRINSTEVVIPITLHIRIDNTDYNFATTGQSCLTASTPEPTTIPLFFKPSVHSTRGIALALDRKQQGGSASGFDTRHPDFAKQSDLTPKRKRANSGP
jgi:hypothetical protein